MLRCMTSGMAQVALELAPAEQLTTEGRCPVCVLTLPLDDDRPRVGTVSWEISPSDRVRIGVAVRFECPNGHSSEDDPALLKAFRSRRF
jgi:hypothetical protein